MYIYIYIYIYIISLLEDFFSLYLACFEKGSCKRSCYLTDCYVS